MKTREPVEPTITEWFDDEDLLWIHQGKAAIVLTHEQAKDLATRLIEKVDAP